jgi:hypothetical protein
LIFADNLSRTWKQVTHFAPQADGRDQSETPAEMVAPVDLSELPTELLGDEELIRDERGVRLAAPVEEAD